MPDQPTEAEVYDLYQDLLDAINDVLRNTADDDVIDILEPLSQELADLLDDDDMLQLEANTAKFAALTPAMKSANVSLKAAQADIDGVADKLADGGKVLSGLTTLLGTVAKFA